MSMLPAFQWLGQSSLGIFMRQFTYAFEIAEMIHLLALAGLGGAILIIDLRVLGVGLKSVAPDNLMREFEPYIIACLCTSMLTGVLLLAAEPLKCYYNPAFRIKMVTLALAVLFCLFVQRPFPERRSVAVVSLALWLGVGLAGRAIGAV